MSEDIKLIKKKKSGILDLRSKGILKKYVWKPRYFILTEKGSIVYYSVDLDKKEKCYKGYISLKNCRLRILDNKKYCFELVDREKEYVIKCRNFYDMRSWVRAIRNELSIISTQRTTNFQYFKPIEVLSSSYENKIYNHDNIDEYYDSDQNFGKPSSYQDGLFSKDGFENDLNPFFINDNEELPEYMKVLEKDIDRDSHCSDEFFNEVMNQIDLIDESEGVSFEEYITITSDISILIKDLNQFNENVKYNSAPLSIDSYTDSISKKKYKKSQRKKGFSVSENMSGFSF